MSVMGTWTIIKSSITTGPERKIRLIGSKHGDSQPMPSPSWGDFPRNGPPAKSARPSHRTIAPSLLAVPVPPARAPRAGGVPETPSEF
jgi:hypothetical protein